MIAQDQRHLCGWSGYTRQHPGHHHHGRGAEGRPLGGRGGVQARALPGHRGQSCQGRALGPLLPGPAAVPGRDPRQDAALPLLHGAAAPLHAAARGAGGGAGGGVAARTHRAAQTFPAQTRAQSCGKKTAACM